MTRDYSPERRALYARVIRVVQPMMWDGRKETDHNKLYRYICSALVGAYANGLCEKWEAHALRDELLARLVGRLGERRKSLEDWLYLDHGVTCTNKPEVIQAHRIWWLEEMLKEFER